MQLLVFNIYGLVNADKDQEAAQRTEDMIQAIFDEIQHQPKLPYIITGDFSGSVGTFPSLAERVALGGLID
eukprot:7462704-Karenia_brevis.AAC.1